MAMETHTCAIYDVKTGQLVARIGPDGTVHSEGNLEAVVALQSLMQRDIVVREHQIDYNPQTADEDYEPYPEENMCYFGVVTLRPGDPNYLKAFLQRLQYVSHYEARPSET